MAHYDLEEQEQLDALKAWWKLYGNLLTNVLLAVALTVLAWLGWNEYQRRQGAEASAVYAVLEQAVAAKDTQKINQVAGELTEKYAGTAYATLSAFLAARHSFEAGDLKAAKVQLSWVVEHGSDEARDVARLRLAAVLLDEKAFDEALKQLDAKHSASFEPLYAEMKGDTFAAQGKKAEARVAYQAALDGMAAKAKADGATETPRTPQRELLQQKLDALGESV